MKKLASLLAVDEAWLSLGVAPAMDLDERRAYNAAEYMEDRRKMMNWWADKLDQLRANRVKSPNG